MGVDIFTCEQLHIFPVARVSKVHSHIVGFRQVVCPVPYVPPTLFVTEEILAIGRNLLWSWYLSRVSEFRNSIAIGDGSSCTSIFPRIVVSLGGCG